jgi:3-oxoacyl-[acyl-carrier-protein] synthase-1
VKPLAISAFTTVSALGRGNAATLAALRGQRGGLRPNPLDGARLETWVGRVDGLESAIDGPLAAYDCRNNRLALAALAQDGFDRQVASARAKYGADRIAVIIGTTTSGIAATERAYSERDAGNAPLPAWFRYRETHNVFSVSDFVRQQLALAGPASAISTACSSSAKVFASAHRLIDAGYVDAALVGGVDSLCLTTLYGFNSLQLLSPHACRPCDEQRDGISIGEAAGFALLERADAQAGGMALLGYGESSDAYHMSTPHPQGDGAVAAIQGALARAGLEPGDIDYVNMHGTGTRSNDAAEDLALYRVFGNAVPCSSTKGWSGHTLGAAGMLEAIFSLLCIQHAFIPGSLNLRQLDPQLKSHIAIAPAERRLRRVLSNSFGFGGSNCSLVFGEAP